MPTSLELLLKQFPGKLFLSVAEVGRAEGRCPKTTRNEIALGIYPVKTVKIGRRRLIPIVEFASYLDSLTTPAPRPGRPRSSKRGA